MTDSILLSIKLPASAETVYNAWIDGRQHRDFTGGNAIIESKNGGHFSAWDGYITGILLKLEPCHRIIQSWRTTEFHPLEPSSTLELLFEADSESDGMIMTLKHTDLPDGTKVKYEQGWREYYFEPMLGFFLTMAEKNRLSGDAAQVS